MDFGSVPELSLPLADVSTTGFPKWLERRNSNGNRKGILPQLFPSKKRAYEIRSHPEDAVSSFYAESPSQSVMTSAPRETRASLLRRRKAETEKRQQQQRLAQLTDEHNINAASKPRSKSVSSVKKRLLDRRPSTPPNEDEPRESRENWADDIFPPPPLESEPEPASPQFNQQRPDNSPSAPNTSTNGLEWFSRQNVAQPPVPIGDFKLELDDLVDSPPRRQEPVRTEFPLEPVHDQIGKYDDDTPPFRHRYETTAIAPRVSLSHYKEGDNNGGSPNDRDMNYSTTTDQHNENVSPNVVNQPSPPPQRYTPAIQSPLRSAENEHPRRSLSPTHPQESPTDITAVSKESYRSKTSSPKAFTPPDLPPGDNEIQRNMAAANNDEFEHKPDDEGRKPLRSHFSYTQKSPEPDLKQSDRSNVSRRGSGLSNGFTRNRLISPDSEAGLQDELEASAVSASPSPEMDERADLVAAETEVADSNGIESESELQHLFAQSRRTLRANVRPFDEQISSSRTTNRTERNRRNFAPPGASSRMKEPALLQRFRQSDALSISSVEAQDESDQMSSVATESAEGSGNRGSANNNAAATFVAAAIHDNDERVGSEGGRNGQLPNGFVTSAKADAIGLFLRNIVNSDERRMNKLESVFANNSATREELLKIVTEIVDEKRALCCLCKNLNDTVTEMLERLAVYKQREGALIHDLHIHSDAAYGDGGF